MTLTASYEHCRRLNARHGRSFYLATLLLPAWKRRHVHALYGFTRHVDDIVDASGEPAADTGGRARAFAIASATVRDSASIIRLSLVGKITVHFLRSAIASCGRIQMESTDSRPSCLPR